MQNNSQDHHGYKEKSTLMTYGQNARLYAILDVQTSVPSTGIFTFIFGWSDQVSRSESQSVRFCQVQYHPSFVLDPAPPPAFVIRH